MFVDEINVTVSAGNGGRGCVAFQRESFRPKGGPSGGNGGKGGDVILEADHDINNLVAQYYQPRLIAPNGEHGMGKGMDGRAGADLIVKVPCGTLVWKLPDPDSEPSNEETDDGTSRHVGASFVEMDLEAERSAESLAPGDSDKGELVADLREHGQRFLLCKGGRGGLGNRNFATSVRQAPRFAQPGEPAETGRYRLELSLLADVGLVGYPNAGKSTLLAAISQARPKIASYPFTTLRPQIGVLEYEDFLRLTVCDVPGIIEGAHENVGLGHAFLRHIRRCRVLVLLIDMSGSEGRAPWDDYKKLLQELECYHPDLLEKPRFVGGNKMDEPGAEGNLARFRRRIRGVSVIPMAAAFDVGLDRFRKVIRKAVEEAQEEEQARAEELGAKESG